MQQVTDSSYDTKEILEEMDHEIAHKVYEVKEAMKDDVDDARRAMIRLRRSLLRNAALLEDVIVGYGREFV